jgi:serine/threonine protein kinase, bacterial
MSVEVVTSLVDSVTVRLREHHDFGFLARLGKVFCVFDEQDSGNICFGIDAGSEKLFVKYAGARTIEYAGDPEEAVRRLRTAMPVYEALRHPGLVELRDHFQVNDGYAAVFAWFPGECLHSHWAFTPDEKYHHPDSPSYRHKHLPLEQRLDSLSAIFAFHEHVAAKGYVAIDLYDGSILYDFLQNTTKICDIDLYHELPYVNRMGRMWGSTRFMSPEEFQQGAAIDEVTNVFNMGAIAFALLGGETDRSFGKWQGSEALYEIALRAVSPNRRDRYSSITAFTQAWDQAREGVA